MKYSALYRLYFQAKDKEAVVTELNPLDRQAWRAIASLCSFWQFDSWWHDLSDEHQDSAFEAIKRVLKKG